MTEPTIAPRPEARPTRELSDETIITPDREVTLVSGRKITISPWGAKKGRLVMERLDAVGPAMRNTQAEGWDPRAMLASAWDEVLDLIELTVGTPRAEIEADDGWAFEDVLAVTEAIFDVCILRSDGKGALPLLLALVDKMTETAVRVLGPALAKKHERDSQKAATSPDKSGNGSA